MYDIKGSKTLSCNRYTSNYINISQSLASEAIYVKIYKVWSNNL